MTAGPQRVVGFTLLILLVQISTASELVYPQHPAGRAVGHDSYKLAEPQICVVIRTYWAHAQSSGLGTLIRSLQRQSLERWEAILLVLDGKPFEELARIVQHFDDDRIWTFAEWIGVQFAPHSEQGWAAGYHHQLYNLTDHAIRACPSTTQWVVVTNGDNEYADSLFETLLATAPDEDIVAMDFYSRYQRPTSAPCTRFEALEGYPPCKPNKMQWCHTDLGANVFRWPRLIAEGHRFGSLADKSGGLTAEHFDGIMMMDLLSSGWKARHLEGKCLFEHSPSPQRCARQGGTWDESMLLPDSPIGGLCISEGQANQLMASHAPHLQELHVRLSSDGGLDAYEGGRKGNDTFIRFAPSRRGMFSVSEHCWAVGIEQLDLVVFKCLRRADAEAQHAEYMRFFGPYCAAEVDLEEFEAHLLAQNMEEVDDQRAQWASQQALSHRPVSSQRPVPPKPPPRGATIEPSFRRRVPART